MLNLCMDINKYFIFKSIITLTYLKIKVQCFITIRDVWLFYKNKNSYLPPMCTI